MFAYPKFSEMNTDGYGIACGCSITIYYKKGPLIFLKTFKQIFFYFNNQELKELGKGIEWLLQVGR